MLYQSLRQLLDYALRKKLIEKEDELYCANRLLALFGLDEWKEPETADDNRPPLAVILGSLCEEAAKAGTDRRWDHRTRYFRHRADGGAYAPSVGGHPGFSGKV